MRRFVPLCVSLVLVSACGGDERPVEETVPDTATVTPMPEGEAPEAERAPGSPVGEEEEEPATEEETTLAEGETRIAASPAETGAPTPPGGYAIDSQPAESGRLARIEYVSPRTVPEVAEFYDGRIDPARKVEIEVAGDDLIAYGLSPNTTLRAGTTAPELERLLNQRSEAIVVISPYRMQRDDPLIRDLRAAGQPEQVRALLDTRSKITVVYAVR